MMCVLPRVHRRPSIGRGRLWRGLLLSAAEGGQRPGQGLVGGNRLSLLHLDLANGGGRWKLKMQLIGLLAAAVVVKSSLHSPLMCYRFLHNISGVHYDA